MERSDLILADLMDRYGAFEPDAKYRRIYSQEDERVRAVFESLHQRLDHLLGFMNEKKRVNGHYNADESRELLDLIEEISEVQAQSKDIGVAITLDPTYRSTIERCRDFLVRSGGSAIPEDFGPITIRRYDPVFTSLDTQIRIGRSEPQRLHLVGQGSFATVHKFIDPTYGIAFARKKARRNLNEREVARFRDEFRILKSLRFPYILEVYAYDEDSESYVMEYCDFTLDHYIRNRNAKIRLASRKRIALQFLYGINYLHSKRILHRDLSRKNVLIKEYDTPAVMVKISDFGLFKDLETDFTRTDSSMKGTLIDPTLSRFKDYDIAAEIYAVGHILSFIFSGMSNLGGCTGDVLAIVNKCVDNDRSKRYKRINEIIVDAEMLSVD